ncbi:exported hypothetical protein [Verrucomicrobia bacterium]|nr:exported hypothetical protein [Verrucomicrobiota bacterium]
MNRVRLLAFIGFIVLAGLILTARPWGTDPHAPRFVPKAPASLPAYAWDDYSWGADVPFEGGKLWVWTALGTNWHAYLFDLERREVMGQLLNSGVPELVSRDGSRLLCRGYDSPAMSIRRELIDFLRKIFGAKTLAGVNRIETFWILDRSNNRATRVGAVSQFPGAGSGWHRSPSARYGYTVPSTAAGSSFVLCDLDTRRLTTVPVAGELRGWWDDQTILIQDRTPNQFVLYDLQTRKTRALFSPAQIENFLASTDLKNDAAGLSVFPNWNGSGYDFYFCEHDRYHGLASSNGFLLKMDRGGPGLRLVDRKFDFRWLGRLDETGTHYLYPGESLGPGKGGDGGVFLHDLASGSNFPVVLPDNKGQYSIPRFYRDEVIYFRNRLLRRIKVDGSGDEPLLPAGGK